MEEKKTVLNYSLIIVKDNHDMKIPQPHNQKVYLECVGEFESTIFHKLHSTHCVQRHSALQLTDPL